MREVPVRKTKWKCRAEHKKEGGGGGGTLVEIRRIKKRVFFWLVFLFVGGVDNKRGCAGRDLR
jgi:hypothetical protein